jgi:hypothetical protein
LLKHATGMFLLRTGKEIVALTVKPGNANMKPPPEMEISIF